jgi:hypothetical protein
MMRRAARSEATSGARRAWAASIVSSSRRPRAASSRSPRSPSEQEQIVERVGVLEARAEALEALLDRDSMASRIEELAQLGLAEELAQLRVIDRQRLRAALGERRVAVVDEARDVREEHRRGERRGRSRVDEHDADGSRRDARRSSRSAGEVEDVLAGTRGRSRA